MAEPLPPIKGTPPHRPTYNMRLSPENIKAIVALVFPDCVLASCEQLKSGASFNNRIYFVDINKQVSPTTNDSSSDKVTTRLVLKLSGYYFGPRKIQNEIGSLLLFQKYCPSIPVPKVVAWSEDGRSIETMGGDTFGYDVLSSGQSSATAPNGWILMTRMPGRLFTKEDFNGNHIGSILEQVAQYFANWRLSIPNVSSIGNLRYKDLSDPVDTTLNLELPNQKGQNQSRTFVIGGLMLCNTYSPAPLPTTLSFYAYIANDQLRRLQDRPQLASLKARIGTQAQSFVDNLPRLSFLQTDSSLPDEIKFTHMDLAPRNLLLSDSTDGSPPPITGLLDLEFASFSPFEDEFVHMQVRQPTDWRSEDRVAIAKALARLGCVVPHTFGQFEEPVCTKLSQGYCTCDSRRYEGLCHVAQITANIAPWFIQGHSHNEEELKKQIDKAADTFLSEMEKLKQFLT